MKRIILLVAIFSISAITGLHSQPSMPPYYQVHGGLFFPALKEFKDVYNSSSDLVWGFGFGVPISAEGFYIFADVSWFKSKGFFDVTTDSTASLSERFIHLGVLDKEFISRRVALRVQAGLNYVTAEQKARSAGGQEQSASIPKKISYFGGLGFEHLIGAGNASVYFDAIYEYRRSDVKEFLGDLGGVRIEIGVTAFLF